MAFGKCVPDDVSVEALTAADPAVLGQVAAVVIAAWGRQPTKEEVAKRVIRLQADFAALDPAAAAIFVASRAGAVVGFGRVMRDQADASQWLLFALAVHPEHRRHGVGTALTWARIEYARQRGARCIRSQTHADNATSIAYHEAAGFVCDGEVTAPDGDRLVQFRMELS